MNIDAKSGRFSKLVIDYIAKRIGKLPTEAAGYAGNS
jgi:hypothetical protein